MLTAIKVHNVLEGVDGIHRDVAYPRLSFDACPVQRSLCMFIAKSMLYIFVRGARELQTLALGEAR
jgi:hypothetical protein